ncbi:hypothetical protein, partial [Acinetobacter baumannii]|uniref:hypothetical protein n=1 Tax=Acinetobacter baumannii TaxID=470 RepID=UPI002892DA57
YSPARELAATAALAVDHTLYQRYDTVWSQQLLAGGGSYWQKNHADGAITEEGQRELVDFVREAAAFAEEHRAEDMISFCTSAIRESANGAAVLARVQ